MINTGRAPYFPFYVQDFIHSCRRSGMTAEEVGVFIVFLCKQWEAGGPVADDLRALTTYCGWDIRSVRRLIERLVSIGKIKRLADGRFSSARMQDEIEKYVARAKAARERENRKRALDPAGLLGEVGGDVSEKFRNIDGPPTGEVSETANNIKRSMTTDGSTDRALPYPYPEPDKKTMPTVPVCTAIEAPDLNARAPRCYTADFEAFWSAYPVKDGKWPAFEKSWRKLSAVDQARATAAAALYAERVQREKIEKPKWAQGWLTDRRFDDELARPGSAAAKRPWWEDPDKLAGLTEDDWGHLISKHANGKWPTAELGYAPGHDRCVVPPTVVAKLRLTERYTSAGLSREQH
ncbi:MAG: YdaU family protein [Hyphomicrobium sp.]|jgi:uncharacterized protein YdaU (DUF1376 family)|uniref:DUF1376 domain-containing protein n=1 Tax=Hyphomicrobium sp. TaxID=82 RepID=UPI0025C20E6E|nr:DUF1376 domain-containing protein [Hyphomicrobium sp.]MBX9863576.1 YdaU family protein [Hyphomicrobium sp.]